MTTSPRQSPMSPWQRPIALLPSQAHLSTSPPCHAPMLLAGDLSPCAPLLCTSWGLAPEKPKLPCIRTVGNGPMPKGQHCFLSSTYIYQQGYSQEGGFLACPLQLELPPAYLADCNPGSEMRLWALLPKPVPHLCFGLFPLRCLCFSQ